MIQPPIVFPSAVTVAIDYLREQLHALGIDDQVVHSIPNPRPTRFVRVLRTGGPRQTIVTDGAQLTIECWADRADQAEARAQVVRALLYVMPYRATDVTVYLVEELAGPSDLPDPLSNQARQTWSVLVHLRGVPL